MNTRVYHIAVKCSNDEGSHVSKHAHHGRCPLIQTHQLTWVTLSSQSWDTGQVPDKDRTLPCVGR